MLAIAALFTILIILGIKLLRWRQKTFSYFKDIGIPGPKPNLMWGNLKEYHEKDLIQAVKKWCKQYGDIFGFYNGDVPMLVVRDLEFQKYVFVKNFSNFTGRGVTMRTDEMHPIVGRGLIHTKGSEWKSMRSCVTSSFTRLKLKQMMDHVAEVGDVFVDVLGEIADQGKEINMLKPFQGLTMDYVGRAAFGIDTCFQKDLNNPFLITAQRTLKEIMIGPFHMLAHCTTSFGRLAAPVLWLSRIFGSFSFNTFSEHTANVIEMRKKHPELGRHDMLQNLIDAEYEDLTSTQISSGDATNAGIKGARKTRALSSEEVIMNSTVLFIGGFETSATSLSFITYALGKYPDVQEKVRQEVKDVVNEGGSLDYETVTQKLKYVIQVINETMRIWPPGLTFTTRQAMEDFEYQGIKYKAGTSIMSPPAVIHMDERFFPDPTKFDPDRFSEENEGNIPKLAFQPFGMGPRNCLGTRLAYLQLTYTVARMTQNFHWELGESQKGEMPIGQYGMVATPGRGPWIVFHRL
uniref:Putative cytochrome n=1 Tax=Ixodes scapularis TaxID=6945 RepID=A0A4D5RQS0_IXOSC